MDVRDYVAACRAHARTVVLVIGVCVGVAAFLSWHRPAVYQARTEFFVSADGGSVDPSQAYQGGLFVQQRVLSYTHVVTSRVVAQTVIRQANVALTPQQFADEVSASVPTNTAILDVRVTDRSPQRATAIATALSRVFPALVGSLEQPSARAASPVKITVITPPQLPTAPLSPHRAVILAIALILSSVVGVAIALMLDTQRRRRRHAAEDAAAGLATLNGHSAADTGRPSPRPDRKVRR